MYNNLYIIAKCCCNYFNWKVKHNCLIPRHSYSILGVLTINIFCCIETRFVVLRNPWGKSGWTGAWGRGTCKYGMYKKEIEEAWKNRPIIRNASVTHKDYGRDARESLLFNPDEDDGVFIMKYKDWINYYNSIGMVIKFPDEWRGWRVRGEWDGSDKYTKHKLTINEENANVFIQCIIKYIQ